MPYKYLSTNATYLSLLINFHQASQVPEKVVQKIFKNFVKIASLTFHISIGLEKVFSEKIIVVPDQKSQ